MMSDPSPSPSPQDGQQPEDAVNNSPAKPSSSFPAKGSSIHTLGKGNLGRINSRYPAAMPLKKRGSDGAGGGAVTVADNSNGNTDTTAGNTTTVAADIDVANDGGGGGGENAGEGGAGGNREQGSSSFSALVSKFNGGSSSGGATHPSPVAAPKAAPQAAMPPPLTPHGSQSGSGPRGGGGGGGARQGGSSEGAASGPESSSSPANGDGAAMIGGRRRKVAIPSFLTKSKPKEGQQQQEEEEGRRERPRANQHEGQGQGGEEEGMPSPPQSTRSGRGFGKKFPIIGKQQPKQQASPPQQQQQQQQQQPNPRQQQPHPNRQTRKRVQQPVLARGTSSSSSGGNNSGRPPPASYSQQQQHAQISGNQQQRQYGGNSHGNMVRPKSSQRLVLERVAARYFLNGDGAGAGSRNGVGSARYAGASDYGDGLSSSSVDGYNDNGFSLGNIDEDGPRSSAGDVANMALPLGLAGDGHRRHSKDRYAVIDFLDGNLAGGSRRRRRSSNGDEGDGANNGSCMFDRTQEDAKNLSVITEGTAATAASGRSGRSASSGQSSSSSQDLQRETDIDAILERASDYLALGKNDLALAAYRRAMKVAFADVLNVKKKLVEVKKRQQEVEERASGDDEAVDLTRQQEQEFELTLLQVAARVADVHNNMGVVHEMNRQYDKARSSYVDALEVYRNTCKRCEEANDPDAERTRMNVERMTLACGSEDERRELHDSASGTASRARRERDEGRRNAGLASAVETLRRALELESETIGSTHPVSASTLVQIGKIHYEMRMYDEAASEMRRAISILRNALGGNHPQVGKTTLLLASIYERHGASMSCVGEGSADDAELELCVDALEPLKATLGEVHPEVGLLYGKIGHLYGKKGDRDLSLLAYKASLKAYGEPSAALGVAGGGPSVRPEVLAIWVRVTEHLTSLGSWEEVVVAGRRALYLLRRSRQSQGALSGANAPVSGGASVAAQLGPGAPSSSAKAPHLRIKPESYRETLFATLQSLGQAHTSLSDYPLAQDACSESLRMAWEIALSAHDDVASIAPAGSKNELGSSILRVVRALKRLGKVFLLEKHYNPALECFLPSLELLRSSKDMESTLDCASVLGSLGFLNLKLKKYTESSNFLRECLRLYQRNGVDSNDRETRKVQTWLRMAESREEEAGITPPSFLEIPTIVIHDEI